MNILFLFFTLVFVANFLFAQSAILYGTICSDNQQALSDTSIILLNKSSTIYLDKEGGRGNFSNDLLRKYLLPISKIVHLKKGKKRVSQN